MDKITAVFSVNYYHVPYVPEIIIDGFFRGKLWLDNVEAHAAHCQMASASIFTAFYEPLVGVIQPWWCDSIGTMIPTVYYTMRTAV